MLGRGGGGKGGYLHDLPNKLHLSFFEVLDLMWNTIGHNSSQFVASISLQIDVTTQDDVTICVTQPTLRSRTPGWFTTNS